MQIWAHFTDSKGRVAGEDGANARLELIRTTLLSRMKKFSISAKQFADVTHHVSNGVISDQLM